MSVHHHRRGFSFVEFTLVTVILGCLLARVLTLIPEVPTLSYLPLCVEQMARIEARWLGDHPQAPGPVSREAEQVLNPHGKHGKKGCVGGGWSYVVDPDGHVRCTVHGTRDKNARTRREWLESVPARVIVALIWWWMSLLLVALPARVALWVGQQMFHAIRGPSATEPRCGLAPPQPAIDSKSCPLCNMQVRLDIAACESCRTTHHASCLEQAGRCAAPSCGRRSAVQRVSPQRAVV